MCACQNMLSQWIDYRCVCNKTNDCPVEIEVTCRICLWKTKQICNVCTICYPHSEEIHEKKKRSACYDCGMIPEEDLDYWIKIFQGGNE